MIGYFGLGVANSVLGHILRDSTPYSPTTSYYVGLFLASTGLRTSDSGSWSEVSTAEYTRVEIRGATGRSFSAPAVGTVSNAENWVWPVAVTSWGTITHLAVLDELTNGSVVIYGELDPHALVNEDDIFRFLSTDLEVSL